MLFPLLISIIQSVPTNWRDRITQGRNIQSFENYTYDISNKYFLIPIQEESGEFKTRIYVDGKFEVVLDIRFAKDKVTYIFPLNTTNWIGKKITINIDVGDNNISNYIFWEQFKQSDEYESKYDYDEKYRPWFHFTPEYGWMNDPNGMFTTKDNVYHFHYQYNPYAAVWGNMHWGHAISSDLLHWEHLPFSIAPDELGQIFSGSSIVDDENLAGYGKNVIFSYYTSAGVHQQQSLAFSFDNGFTFKKYDKNPLIPNTDKVDFRDPKVIKIKKNGETKPSYVMCLAVGDHVEFYSSSNLIDWTYTSSFGEKYGTHGGVWECPDLLYYEEFNKYVLFVNVNPGGPFGGSACQYFVGQFDGEKFTCDDPPETIRWLEYGKDAYATVTYPVAVKKESRSTRTEYIAMTWMSNWEYAAIVPSIYYRSSVAIPRKISLIQIGEKFAISNLPLDSINSIRDKTDKIDPFSLSGSEKEKVIKNAFHDSSAFEVDFEFSVEANLTVGIKFTNEKSEEYVIKFDSTKNTVSCDRTKSGIVSFSEAFPVVTAATIPVQKETYKWRFFIDTCSIEFFDEDGFATMTNLVYPTTPYSNIVVFKSDDKGILEVKPIEVHSLSKIMHRKSDDDGGDDDKKPSKNDLNKTLLIVVCVVSAVAVIAIIVLVIILVKWRKNKKNNMQNQENKPNSSLLNETS